MVRKAGKKVGNDTGTGRQASTGTYNITKSEITNHKAGGGGGRVVIGGGPSWEGRGGNQGTQ